jgi:tetratricopeptide (TPR) repeat protein
MKALLPATIAAVRTALEKSPGDESLSRGLAQLLVDDLPSTAWHFLEPVSMSADSNCTLTLQPDGSILSGPADTPRGDSFTIRSRIPLRRLAALRLETFAHTSLSNQGQGWQAGNFCLTEVRAELARVDGTRHPLKFRFAASDYVRDFDTDTQAMDGPWSVIDGEQVFRWDVHPQIKTPHWLALEFAEPIDVAENDELIVHLDFRHALWFQFRLGCFRISVSEDGDAARKQVLATGIRAQELTAAESLATLDLFRGDAAPALKRLTPGLGADAAVSTPFRLLLLVQAHQQLGDIAAARLAMDGLLHSIADEPPPRALFGLFLETATELGDLSRQELLAAMEVHSGERVRLDMAIQDNPQFPAAYNARAAYYSRRGEWPLAVTDFVAALPWALQDRIQWQHVAIGLLLAGDEAAYQAHCRAMLDHFQDATDPQVIGTMCKVCLLASDAVELSSVPIQQLRDGITDPAAESYRVFAIPNCALASYREGNYEDAISWANKSPNMKEYIGAQVYLTRAMAEEKLGRHDAAVQSLALGEALIPEELATLGTPDYNGALPVDLAKVYRDWLVDEILRREAALLIHNDARRRVSPVALQAECNRLASLGQWSEAAQTALDRVAIMPNERLAWSHAAALLAMAGDREAYRQLCARMIQQFTSNLTAYQADSICKSCSILPGSVDRAALPVNVLQNALEQPTEPDGFRAWGYACLALVAYRDGDFQRAGQLSKRSIEFNRGQNESRALALLVLAMAQHQLKEEENSRRSLAEAAALIPPELATLGTKEYDGPLPVNSKLVNWDWLIAETLRREAALLFDGSPGPGSSGASHD